MKAPNLIPFSKNSNHCLFHYTNLNALSNIVENSSLWLTNIYYLNDSLEIKFAASIFENILDELYRRKSSDSIFKEFIRLLKKWVTHLEVTPQHIFSISFCENGDQLSQWRGYSKHGAGISIGFYKNDLLKIVKDNDLELSACLYEPQQQRDYLAGLIYGLFRGFQKTELFKNPEQMEQACHTLFDVDFKNMVLRSFAKMKHASFKEENEWRLISRYYPKYTVSNIKFRPANTTMIPYIELKLIPLLAENPQVEKPLFRSIYTGPSTNDEIKFHSISHFLSNKKACFTTLRANQTLREL